MDRRTFVRFGIAGAAATIAAPRPAQAASKSSSLDGKMAGGVYYTKDAPGRWGKKVGGHVPIIEKKADSGGKTRVRVTTRHGMPGYEHYIVKHVLLDKDFKFIAEKMFDPKKDKKPVSTFVLDGYRGPLYALSVCNKHDTWIDVIEL